MKFLHLKFPFKARQFRCLQILFFMPKLLKITAKKKLFFNHCGLPQQKSCSRSGQAMVEFVVAAVLIMLVVGGILAVASLQRADSKSMLDATTEAIEDSMGNSISKTFSPIKDWDNGVDGYEQTKDDKAKGGSLANVRNAITGHAVPNGDWSAFERGDGNSVVYGDIKQLDSSGSVSTIGMIEGNASETAEIPPVIQRSLGMPDEVEVENQVWMPKTEGLY